MKLAKEIYFDYSKEDIIHVLIVEDGILTWESDCKVGEPELIDIGKIVSKAIDEGNHIDVEFISETTIKHTIGG